LTWTKAEIEALDFDEAQDYFKRLMKRRKQEAEAAKKR
jgi:hypothetical protein